jgi:hypothetical protein
MLNKFKEFLIEKIEITKVEFGNKKPFNNNKFSTDSGDNIFTFFKHEDAIVLVELNGKSFNFGILENDGSINLQHSNTKFNFKNIQQFYGEILYVFNELITRYYIDQFIVYSHPNETKVVKLYKSFATNKNIQSILKSMGFNYRTYKQTEDDFTFEIHHFYKSKNIISNLIKLVKK